MISSGGKKFSAASLFWLIAQLSQNWQRKLHPAAAIDATFAPGLKCSRGFLPIGSTPKATALLWFKVYNVPSWFLRTVQNPMDPLFIVQRLAHRQHFTVFLVFWV
jgi:hypothetical protein